MNTQQTPAPRRRRWVTIVLTLSLALNLLVVGAVSARFIFGHGGYYGRHHRAGGQMIAAGRNLMWSVPRERRNELRGLIRQNWPQFEAMHGDRDKARAALAEAIAADPFDPARFDSAFAAMTASEARTHDKIRQLGRLFILKLSAEERAVFAGELKKPRRWRHH